jgi:uncharacterized SAM-binding protein YcdF (DUF218 family)
MRRLTAILVLILLVIIFGYFSYPVLLDKMAQYLVVQDKLQKADLILILGGDINGERLKEGVNLFRQGYAKKLLISGGPVAFKLTYADWIRKQAIEQGIPASAILTQSRSLSTIDDAELSLPIIKKHQIGSVIMVTSPYHCRRAGAVFKKIYQTQGIKIIVHPAAHSVFNPAGWWKRHEDTAFVVWEYVAMVLYFFKGY